MGVDINAHVPMSEMLRYAPDLGSMTGGRGTFTMEFDSYEELAQAIGCKTGTARVRMHRAMKQLNAAFTEINGAPINA